MSEDRRYAVAHDAQARLAFEYDLRHYRVPYKIEGTVTVWASDAESAKALVDAQSPLAYAADGVLETYDAEPVVQ